MKKICLIVFFFLSFSVFANELKIQSLRLINTMTYDKNDKFRYSPLKLFDQKDDTAFAFPQKELHDYLLCIIHFDKEYELDEIDIKAGFFDPKWYVKNYRIKEIEFIFNYNATLSDVLKENFILKDEMVSQKLKFSKRIKCADLWIRAKSLYPSKAYNDICISEMKFFNKGTEYNILIRPSIHNIPFGSEYEYNSQGKITREKIKAEFDTYDLQYYQKDGTLFGKCKLEDEDGVLQEFTYKTITFSDNCEDINMRGEHIKHYYENGKVIRSEVKDRNGEKYSINYYYKNGLLDHTDYGEFFYENGLLKGYIAYGYFFVNDEIDRILKLNKEFCSYYLDYNDKNQIIKRIVATYNGYSAVK